MSFIPSFLVGVFLVIGFVVCGQQDTLPFRIDEGKKLSDERLAKKKEGWFVTGLPRASYDPIQGIGVGARGQVYFNATKDDPFFAYTPYRLRSDFSLNFTQNGKVAAGVKFDMPYFLNTKWRTRFRFDFADNPNKLYFGIGESSLENLSYTDPVSGEIEENLTYDEYILRMRTVRPGNATIGEDPNILYTDRRYNWIHYRKYAADLLAERTLLDGKLRWLNGLGLTHLSYRHYDFQLVEDALDTEGNTISAPNGVSKLTEDYLAGQTDPLNSSWGRNNISGYEGGFLVKLKAGLIYDTRDFEPDPTRGSLIEYSFGYSPSWLGSDFNYVRNQFQAQHFMKVLSFLPNTNILAGRLMMSSIQGSNVFFREVYDIWSANDGRVGVLGGEDAIRGYKKFRFGGMVYGYANLELRSKLTKFTVLKQDIELAAVPFFDFGRVYDNLQGLTFRGMKYSPGLGLRIAWNQSTILRADYAFSKEDQQLFLVIGHIF